jgi:3-oxoacyl-[acyl-carrier-protein] synthase-3
MYRSWISGTGSYLPEKKLTNYDLEKMMDTTNDWIVERTGIHSRSLAEPGVGTSDLALIASRQALEMAGLDAKDIDMIVFGTLTPDYVMPSASCELQRKLGARNVMSFDLVAACSGFVYGATIADQFIRSGQCKNVLVVGAEILHNNINYEDRQTAILFGDAAGAAVVSRAEPGQESMILSSHMYAEGNLANLLMISHGGSLHPMTHEALDKKLNCVQMNGREIFKNAVRAMASGCQEALRVNNVSPEEVSWVVPHQANTRIMEAVADHVGIPYSKFIVCIEDMGNTSAATVPVALNKAIRDGRVQKGQYVLLTAFGAGLTSGSILLRY